MKKKQKKWKQPSSAHTLSRASVASFGWNGTILTLVIKKYLWKHFGNEKKNKETCRAFCITVLLLVQNKWINLSGFVPEKDYKLWKIPFLSSAAAGFWARAFTAEHSSVLIAEKCIWFPFPFNCVLFSLNIQYESMPSSVFLHLSRHLHSCPSQKSWENLKEQMAHVRQSIPICCLYITVCNISHFLLPGNRDFVLKTLIFSPFSYLRFQRKSLAALFTPNTL